MHQHFRIVQCISCGLVYSNPILSEDEITELYRNSGFIHELQLNNMVADYLEQLDGTSALLPSKENLLEIGCANGYFLKKAKEYGFKNVYGIEPSRAAYSQTPEEILPNIINDELRSGLFPDEHFDLICFFQVFDHIVDPNWFLQTVRGYLRRGGNILAIHHNIKALMPTILGSRASTYDVSHIYLWDRRTMRRVLEKNGFELLYVKNVASRYQIDHVVRMLPLPALGKRVLRNLLRWLGLSNKDIKVPVENMVTVARKP